MKFHPPHTTSRGDAFAINDDGTGVQITLHDQTAPIVLSGERAQHLHRWLDAAALRTDQEAAAAAADAKTKPPREINSGFKVELEKGSNKHVHVATMEEAIALRARIDAVDSANAKGA